MLSRRIIKFMHYFHNLFSSGALPQIPLGLHPWTPLGDFRPRPIICPPLEKSCGRPWSRLYTSCYGIRTDSPCISIKRPQRFYATNHSGKMLMLWTKFMYGAVKLWCDISSQRRLNRTPGGGVRASSLFNLFFHFLCFLFFSKVSSISSGLRSGWRGLLTAMNDTWESISEEEETDGFKWSVWRTCMTAFVQLKTPYTELAGSILIIALKSCYQKPKKMPKISHIL